MLTITLLQVIWLKALTFSSKGLWLEGVAGKGRLSRLSYHDDNSALQPRGRRNLIGWLHKPPGSPVGGRWTDRWVDKQGEKKEDRQFRIIKGSEGWSEVSVVTLANHTNAPGWLVLMNISSQSREGGGLGGSDKGEEKTPQTLAWTFSIIMGPTEANSDKIWAKNAHSPRDLGCLIHRGCTGCSLGSSS